MGTTPVCTIDATGIHKPTFADCLAYFTAQYQGIYGKDIYIAPDSQDGQWLGIQATALDDANSMAVAVYNSFSPTTAQGTGLASNVKINGMVRKVPTFSTADVVIVGQAGAVLTNCVAMDAVGNKWLLPSTVTIPYSGQITVSATAALLGAIAAPAGSITGIATPTQGFQSITNPNAAIVGAPTELDAALRQRQTVSTMLPSSTVYDGIIGAIQSVPGFLRMRAYENNTNLASALGIPANSLCFVIDGGDPQIIANVIALKKTPGIPTFGTTTMIVPDSAGVPRKINFFRPTVVPITYVIQVRALKGFTLANQAQLQQAVSDWTNALGIGTSVLMTRVYGPASLTGLPAGLTYELISVAVARDGLVTTLADVAITFNEAPICQPAYVSIQLVP